MEIDDDIDHLKRDPHWATYLERNRYDPCQHISTFTGGGSLDPAIVRTPSGTTSLSIGIILAGIGMCFNNAASRVGARHSIYHMQTVDI